MLVCAMGLSNHVNVISSNAYQLVLERCKIKALIELIWITLFFTLWYCILIDDFSSFSAIKDDFYKKFESNKLIVIFYFAPLLVSHRIYLGISTLTVGNRYTFSLAKGVITHNGRKVCRISQVRKVRVKRRTDSESDDSFRLDILYSNNQRLFMAESTDRQYVLQLANDIATICEIEVEFIN